MSVLTFSVLLVLKNDELLARFARQLRSDGHVVIEQSAAHVAIQCVQPAGFDVVFADGSMLDAELAQFLPELRRAFPEAIIILVTAETDRPQYRADLVDFELADSTEGTSLSSLLHYLHGRHQPPTP